MGKTLVIAEKPSVATDIARALGGCKREKDYLENDDYIISSAVGHLLEIHAPDGVEVKRGKWKLDNLPVIPPHFELRPIEKSEPRLKVLSRLARKKDVDTVINACDAGREGELIFRYIVQYLKCKKPVHRLWLQSMTPAAIRDAFAQLKADSDMQPLADAATCRSEADWLVGINGTRAMTAFNSKSGGFQLTTVGRVQTPTLTIVVEREEAIRSFVPRDYSEVHATFKAEAGEYAAKWIDEAFKRVKDGDPDLRADRIWERAKADAIVAACTGKPGPVTEESKPSKQLSPLLFDLTSLQREANARFGFSASNTLKIAQALYERHKVLTYPRTDSRALPEDYLGTVKKTLTMLDGSGFAPHAGTILDSDWVVPNKRIFNNAKVSDHFAIIPTTQAAKKLSEPEQKLYDLVVKRFLAVFFPAAEYRVTTRITRVEEHAFKTDGKVLVNPGWLAVYGRTTQSNGGSGDLVPVIPGETVQTLEIEVQDFQTKPPPRYTEATLLSAMEGAGKLVDDQELKAAMSEKGLGTPATRASIIEGLLKEKYLVRNLKELQPSAKAFSLITLLRALEIPGLHSPELTGNWEYKLKQIEQRNLSREEFMREIAEMTRDIVAKTKQYESDTVPGDFATLETPCPKCGGVVKENYKKFSCQSCDWDNWKILAGRQLEVPEMEILLKEKAVGPLQGFRSKMGRSFDAALKLNDEFKIEFDFGNDDEDGAAEVDFSGQEPLGKCPKCGANVYDGPMSYTCEKAVGKEKSCDFRTGKIILKRPMEREQVVKLLTNRKTDLLEKFISKRGRPFKAYLVLEESGKVSFEFEPKAAKKTASKTAAAKKDGEADAE